MRTPQPVAPMHRALARRGAGAVVAAARASASRWQAQRAVASVAACTAPWHGVTRLGTHAARLPTATAAQGCRHDAKAPTPARRYLSGTAGTSSAAVAEDYTGSPRMFEQAAAYGGSTAVVSANGDAMTYAELLKLSEALARRILAAAGSTDGSGLQGRSVGFLCTPGVSFVVAQWAAWRAGGTCVPLCVSHPPAELDYVIEDSACGVLIGDADFIEAIRSLASAKGRAVLEIALDGTPVNDEGVTYDGDLPALTFKDGSHIIYTSGTTGRPKGVLHSHRAMQAQITDLVSAWGWSSDDRILHVLPLHHTHGLVNKLACALWSGATCEFMPFSPTAVWDRLASRTGDGRSDITLFMAVPTVYVKLIEAFDAAWPADQSWYAEGARALRLMVSGSAPLPISVLERWRAITGHTLLERYGMSEFGMALSNPLEPESRRRPGCVGQPLPSAEVRIVDTSSGSEVEIAKESGASGELRVRGAILFDGYLNRPDANAESFDADGWFLTGDIATWSLEDEAYKILGRASVDIIKTGGHKVSALEIEREYLEHPGVAEIAVLGVADDTWGQRVVAVVRMQPNSEFGRMEPEEAGKVLVAWGTGRLAAEKTVREAVVVADIPKNAMGKVNKKQLAKEVIAQ